MRNLPISQIVRAVCICFGALLLYTLVTFPTRMRLAREHYAMWREERQLAKERRHAAQTIARVKARRSRDDEPPGR